MTDVNGRKRFSSLAGAAAVALWVAGVLLIGGGHLGLPGGLPEEPAADVLAFYSADADRVTAGAWAFMLGALCFVWFAAYLSTVLTAGRSDLAVGGLGRAATATGVVTGVLVLLTAVPGLVTALGAEQLDAAAAQALDAVGAVFFIGAEMTAVAMLATLALLARRTGALPRAWALTSLALAGWLAVLPIGWVGLLAGVPLWTLATVCLLLRRDAGRQTSVSGDNSERSGDSRNVTGGSVVGQPPPASASR